MSDELFFVAVALLCAGVGYLIAALTSDAGWGILAFVALFIAIVTAFVVATRKRP